MKIFANFNYLRIEEFGKMDEGDFMFLLERDYNLSYSPLSNKIFGEPSQLFNLLVELSSVEDLTLI